MTCWGRGPDAFRLRCNNSYDVLPCLFVAAVASVCSVAARQQKQQRCDASKAPAKILVSSVHQESPQAKVSAARAQQRRTARVAACAHTPSVCIPYSQVHWSRREAAPPQCKPETAAQAPPSRGSWRRPRSRSCCRCCGPSCSTCCRCARARQMRRWTRRSWRTFERRRRGVQRCGLLDTARCSWRCSERACMTTTGM